jgi:hypothetical protein
VIISVVVVVACLMRVALPPNAPLNCRERSVPLLTGNPFSDLPAAAEISVIAVAVVEIVAEVAASVAVSVVAAAISAKMVAVVVVVLMVVTVVLVRSIHLDGLRTMLCLLRKKADASPTLLSNWQTLHPTKSTTHHRHLLLQQ